MRAPKQHTAAAPAVAGVSRAARYRPSPPPQLASEREYALLHLQRPESILSHEYLDSWVHQGLVRRPESRALLHGYRKTLSPQARAYARKTRTPELCRPTNVGSSALSKQRARHDQRAKDAIAEVERVSPNGALPREFMCGENKDGGGGGGGAAGVLGCTDH
jgi:hypothetical protein